MTATPNAVTLKRTPERALHFLIVLAQRPALRRALAGVGFTEAEAAEGMRLISRLTLPDAAVVEPDATSPAHAAAEARLAADARALFKRGRAALERAVPDLAAELFGDLPAGTPGTLTIIHLYQRLRALQQDTRPLAVKANAVLEARGLGRAHLDAMKASLDVVMRLAPQAAGAGQTPAMAPPPLESHAERLLAVYLWFREWSEAAHATFTKRQDLIALGLAKPQRRAPPPA
jgi:hypothetical protein